MVRVTSRSGGRFALAGGIALFLISFVFLAPPSGADEVSADSASTGGESSASGSAGGGGSPASTSSASLSGSNDSQASVSQSNAQAETTSSGGALAVQTGGNNAPAAAPTVANNSPAPAIANDNPAPAVADDSPPAAAAADNTADSQTAVQDTHEPESPVEGPTDVVPAVVQVATSPPVGTDLAVAAAGTQANAEAHNDGDVPHAEATADAGAAGLAVETEPQATLAVAAPEAVPGEKSAEVVAPVVVTDLGLVASGSHATAVAEGGEKPMAYASAGSGVFALAIAGENPQVEAHAGLGEKTQYTEQNGEKVSVAWLDAGQYSIAIASKDQATAYSSTFGEGNAYTSEEVYAKAKTAAYAYANATRTTAFALASAKADSSAHTSDGFAVAASASRAFAKIKISIIPDKPKVASGGGSIACAVKVLDWDEWLKTPIALRNRIESCECPSVLSAATDEGDPLLARLCRIRTGIVMTVVR